MQFRSITYDSTEIDIQYALDSRGNEIREVQLDEAFSGENLVEEMSGWEEGTSGEYGWGVAKERKSVMTQNTTFK